MSSEQVKGRPLPASDQYALGVVVYEWLCGFPPFHGSFTELCSQHMFAPPPPLSEKVPSIPPEFEQVVMRALAKEPAQRFDNVATFAAALQQASQARQNRASGGGMTVYIWNALDGKQMLAYQEHTDRVNTLAWSPDGKRIASGGQDKLVYVWDAADGGHVVIYRGHTDYVNAVAWSPDGKYIVSGGNDETVQIWDAANGKTIFIYRGHSSDINVVAWSRDGKWIASGGDGRNVLVWKAL